MKAATSERSSWHRPDLTEIASAPAFERGDRRSGRPLSRRTVNLRLTVAALHKVGLQSYLSAASSPGDQQGFPVDRETIMVIVIYRREIWRSVEAVLLNARFTSLRTTAPRVISQTLKGARVVRRAL
jgi:hypothetical protein